MGYRDSVEEEVNANSGGGRIAKEKEVEQSASLDA